MIDDIELKGLSIHTQRSYLLQVNQFIRHFGKSPRQLGEKEIKAYLLYLLREKKYVAGSVNQCYHALKFLYEITLNRDRIMTKITRLKSVKQLPVVLDKEEVESLFSVIKNIKHRAILMLIYSSGLRLMEAAQLKWTPKIGQCAKVDDLIGERSLQCIAKESSTLLNSKPKWPSRPSKEKRLSLNLPVSTGSIRLRLQNGRKRPSNPFRISFPKRMIGKERIEMH